MPRFKVSVIVPFYNASEYLERCVKSLMNQSLNELEYIFVNDGSIDDSLDVLNKIIINFPHRIDFIKIINIEENLGSASARNAGLIEAEGEYIAWADADDWVDNDMYEKLYEYAIETTSDIVYCDFYLDESIKSTIVKQFYKSNKFELISNMILGLLKGALWNKLIKHSLYKENNIQFIPNADMGEDLQALVKLYSFSKKTTYLSTVSYHWVRNNTSIMANVFTKSTIDIGWIINIKEIDRFINKFQMYSLTDSLNLLKLRSKNKLIIHAKVIDDYKKWLTIFPEVNNISYRGKEYPIYFKPVLWCICKNIWLIPTLWLFLRKIYK